MLRASLFVIGAVNAIQAPTNIHDMIQGAIHAQTEATGDPTGQNPTPTASIVDNTQSTNPAIASVANFIQSNYGPTIRNLLD